MFVAYFCCAASGTSQEYAKMVKNKWEAMKEYDTAFFYSLFNKEFI